MYVKKIKNCSSVCLYTKLYTVYKSYLFLLLVVDFFVCFFGGVLSHMNGFHLDDWL